MYSPVRVSMRIISPSLMNRGTRDLRAGFQGGGLQGVGSGIAAHAGLGLGDFQFHKVGRLHAKHIVLIRKHLAIHVLFNELEVIVEHALVDRDLLVGFVVHEVIQVAVAVKVLHIFALDISSGVLVSGVKRLFRYGPGDHVAQLGAHKGSALAGLHVLELDDRSTRRRPSQRLRRF